MLLTAKWEYIELCQLMLYYLSHARIMPTFGDNAVFVIIKARIDASWRCFAYRWHTPHGQVRRCVMLGNKSTLTNSVCQPSDHRQFSLAMSEAFSRSRSFAFLCTPRQSLKNSGRQVAFGWRVGYGWKRSGHCGNDARKDSIVDPLRLCDVHGAAQSDNAG